MLRRHTRFCSRFAWRRYAGIGGKWNWLALGSSVETNRCRRIGAWRQRLALSAAAVTAKQAGRSRMKRHLRDAVLLTAGRRGRPRRPDAARLARHRKDNRQLMKMCVHWAMSEVARDPLYGRHRFPAEIIAHAVWLYFRFPLSLRMVEDMLAARGIIVTHQTVRSCAEKFGRHSAQEINISRLPGRQMASRRMCRGYQWQEAVALACRRSGRLRPRSAGTKPPKCQGGKASDAQVAESSRADTTDHDHRQAPIL